MSKPSSFDLYCQYRALVLHFTTNYDYIKYNGKTNVSPITYNNKQKCMKHVFMKLREHEDPKNFIIANLIYRGCKLWPQKLLKGEQADAAYLTLKKYNQSLKYTFSEQIKHLDKKFNENFKGDNPLLLQLYANNTISIDTLTIIDTMVKFSPQWNNTLVKNDTWNNIKLIVNKYKPFRPFDRNMIKDIIVSNFS